MADRKPCNRCAAFRAFPATGYERGWGECRRHAPSLAGDSDLTWPRVERSNWCLEYVGPNAGREGGGND